jgi:hypothetical protein
MFFTVFRGLKGKAYQFINCFFDLTDLHLTGNQYSWAGSILYLGVSMIDALTIRLTL